MISVVQMHVAVFGSSRSGKTCAIKALCGLPFESTLAGNVNDTHVYEGVLPQLHSTATGHSTTVVKARFYSCEAFDRDPILLDQVISGTHAVLVIYDVTSDTSYQKAVKEVYPSLRRRYHNAFFVLVGTKSDATGRKVSIRQVEQFVAQEGIYFMEISAKVGTNLKLLLSILRIRARYSADLPNEPEPSRMHTGNKLSPVAALDAIRSQALTPRSSFKTSEDPILEASIALDSPEGAHARFNVHSPHLTINSILGRVSPIEQSPRGTPPDVQNQRGLATGKGLSLDDSASLELEWHSSSPTSARDRRKSSHSSYKSFMSEPVLRSRPSGSYLNPTLSWNQKRSAAASQPRGIDNTRSHPKMRSTAFSQWPSEGGPENDEPKGYTPSTIQKHAKSSTSAPHLYVDVHAGNAKVGIIAIREGDNAYHLATEFCRKHNLAASYTKKLADTLAQRVAQFYNTETRYIQAQIKEEAIGRPLSQTHSRQRNGARRGSTETTPEPRSRRMSLRERPLLGKLHVKVSRGKVAKLAVREGDDPAQVAQSFGRTYGLHKLQVKQIEQRVRDHIREAQWKPDDEEPIRAPRRKPPQVPSEREVLFKLEIDVGRGNIETIMVRTGDVPETLAADFVQQHQLDPSKVERVADLIRNAMQSAS